MNSINFIEKYCSSFELKIINVSCLSQTKFKLAAESLIKLFITSKPHRYFYFKQKDWLLVIKHRVGDSNELEKMQD